MTPSPLIPLKRVFQEYKGYHAAVGVLPALLAVLEEAESYLTSPMEWLSESLISLDKKPSAIV